MIQGSINQLLSMATIGASLSPDVQRRAEVRQTKSKAKELHKMHGVLKDKLVSELKENLGDPSKTVSEETREQVELLGGKVQDVKQTLFELSPSEKRLESLYKTSKARKAFSETLTEYDKFKETQGLGLNTPEEKAKYFLAKEQGRVGKSREATRQQLLANAPAPMMGRRDNKNEYNE